MPEPANRPDAPAPLPRLSRAWLAGADSLPVKVVPGPLVAWRTFDPHCQPRMLAAAVRGNATLWGRNLDSIPGLTDRASASVSSILRDGVRAAAHLLIA